MGTEENVAASAGDRRDDPETVSNKETQSRCKALTKKDERCKKTASHGSKYCPVHQRMAERWAQQANAECTSPEEEVVIAKDPEWPLNDPTWRQQAFFMLFFGHVTDEHGKQVWHTCVYHDESGQQKAIESTEPIARENFAGVVIDPWVDWVLERANLPAASEPTPTETGVAAPAMPYGAQLEILDVQVSKIKPSPDLREKKLKAEVRFQISGPKAEALTAERVPVHIEVHTVNLESKALNLVVSEWSQLQPGVFEYAIQQAFPIPEFGRYQLRSIVLLHLPGETMAYHLGPTIKVVP